MGTESFDAQLYAKDLCNKLEGAAGIRVGIYGLAGGGGQFYSTLDKKVIAERVKRVVTRATICLDFNRITTPIRVRAALSHEIAHLVPGDKTLPFKERWRVWWRIFDELDKI